MERCHSKYYDLTPVAETEVTDAFCYRERRWRTHEWKGRGATQQTAWCEKLNQSHYVPTDSESYVLCSGISLTQCFNIKSSNQCALRQLSKLNSQNIEAPSTLMVIHKERCVVLAAGLLVSVLNCTMSHMNLCLVS